MCGYYLPRRIVPKNTISCQGEWSDFQRSVSVLLLYCFAVAFTVSVTVWVAGLQRILFVYLCRKRLNCGMWWHIGWVYDFQPGGRGFDSCSSHHVGTLGKSFTFSCLCASTPILYSCCSRERLWVVVDLKGRYRNGQSEWMKLLMVESACSKFRAAVL